MSQWYNPVSDVVDGRVGRPLVTSSDHASVMRQLKPGEHLYVLGDRLMFKQIGCMDRKEEYDQYYSQYAQGYLITIQAFAFDEEAHQRALQAVV